MTLRHHPDQHDPAHLYEESAPHVERLTVTRVTFRRGVGCCEHSVVRMVTAYYDEADGFITEIDPHPDTLLTASGPGAAQARVHAWNALHSPVGVLDEHGNQIDE